MTFEQTTPFPHPSEDSKAPAPKELTPEQQSKYDKILAHFKELKELPTDPKSSDMQPLSDREKAWLSRECFLRYLRATKWNTEHSIKRLESTLVWRRHFGVEKLTGEQCSHEHETGKEVILGWDKDARPCMYLQPGKQNTKASHAQVEALVFMLERVIDFMIPNQDQLALLIDFKPYKVPKAENLSKLPSLGTGREVLNILQDHYPERLGRALLTNMPRLAKLFLKMIHPFIDPLTREKLVFSEPFPNYVPVNQLQSDFGGNVDFEYQHKIYWPALCKMYEARHEYYLSRWRALGAEIGMSESELRAGFDDSIPQEEWATAIPNGIPNGTPVEKGVLADDRSDFEYVDASDSDLTAK